MNEPEHIYLSLREKEGRLYSDEIIRKLPFVEKTSPFYTEWIVRAGSFEKLSLYLRKKDKPLQILDLGAGNCWMSNALSKISGVEVTAVDINKMELEQGARVFKENKRLNFIYGNIFEEIVSPASFDIITLAASIQYFPDLPLLLTRLLKLLKPAGEIHILDSPFYTHDNVAAAKKRSEVYYKQLGFPEMSNHYHHHTWDELNPFDYSVKNRSVKDIIKIRFLKDPSLIFPWLVIINPDHKIHFANI